MRHTAKYRAILLGIIAIGIPTSCSKEESITDKITGNWQTESVSFDYYSDGIKEVRNWPKNTDVPERLILNADGTFSMRAKQKTCTGKWEFDELTYEGLEFEGKIYLEYDSGSHPSYDVIDLLNHWDNTLKLGGSPTVDPGAVIGYDDGGHPTYPNATFTMERL